MAVSMKAGTAVILNLSPSPPPPVPAVFRRKFPKSLFSGASFSSRTSNLRIRSVSKPHDQGDSYESSNNVNVTPTSASSFVDGLLSNLLPVALLVGVVLGFKSPTLGTMLYKNSLSKYITFWLFFKAGLRLEDGDIKEVGEAWPAVLYGLASILLICPLFSRLLLKISMVPQEFITGIAIFNCMPTTLNGGIALTQLVGGNAPLALALTVISVLSGILIVPLWITKFFAEVAIPTRKLFTSLVITLIIPLALGKVCRNVFPGMARFAERNDRLLSITTSILIGFFPWMQVSISRELLLLVKPQVFVSAILIGMLVHLCFLTLNATFVRCLSLGSPVFEKKGNIRALMLVCSQRSLFISTAVIEQLGGVLGETGLMLLPCVACDVNQIIVDSLLVNFWTRKDESRETEETLKLA